MSEAELLDKADLDVVLVETHVRDLLATAQRAIDRGLHVHLDKPPDTIWIATNVCLNRPGKNS